MYEVIDKIIHDPLSCILSGYLIGGIPFGYILVKLKKGVDIRTLGSGNVGATNVGRVLGWPWGVLCFLLDAIKGYIPTAFVFSNSMVFVGVTDSSGNSIDGFMLSFTYPIYIGLGLIIGHLFPVYLRFKGGRGVATGLGVFLVISWLPTMMAVASWILFLIRFRYVSLASIIAAITLVASTILLHIFASKQFSGEYYFFSWILAACIVVAILIIIRHIPNIKRLINGTEPKVRLWRTKEQKN